MSPSDLISLLDTFPKDYWFAFFLEFEWTLVFSGTYSIIDMCLLWNWPLIWKVNAQPLNLNVKEAKKYFHLWAMIFIMCFSFSFLFRVLCLNSYFLLFRFHQNYECFSLCCFCRGHTNYKSVKLFFFVWNWKVRFGSDNHSYPKRV